MHGLCGAQSPTSLSTHPHGCNQHSQHVVTLTQTLGSAHCSSLSPISTAAPLWSTGCLILDPRKSIQVNLTHMFWQYAHHHVAESISGDSLGYSELKLSPRALQM